MAAEAPEILGVVTSDHYAPGPDSAPDVMVRIYQPESRPETLPALLWIHGGGYVIGNVQGDDLKAKGMVLALNCVVASVEYRLAPEHPFPAPLEDCYAALKWLTGNADEFDINPARIAIGGASAGGGLAAGLGLLARDRAEVDVCYQLLIYPMIDDSNVEQAGPDVPDAPLGLAPIIWWGGVLIFNKNREVMEYLSVCCGIPCRECEWFATDLKAIKTIFRSVETGDWGSIE